MSLPASYDPVKTEEQVVAELNELEKRYHQNMHMLGELFRHGAMTMRAQHYEARARLAKTCVKDADRLRESSVVIQLRIQAQHWRDKANLVEAQIRDCAHELERYSQRCQALTVDLTRGIRRVLKQVPGDKQRARQRGKRILRTGH